MLGIKVEITRYVSDEPQPGLVECQLVDAHGRRWLFLEKTAVVSAEYIDARTHYPQLGLIAGTVVNRGSDDAGREVVQFDTEQPWGVMSVEGATLFEVLPMSLVEW